MPGAATEGAVPALDFLIASNRKGFGDAVAAFDDGTLDAAGKHVVVIGGGDTAMDCVRTAIRQGAKSVKCLYRRDRANMPGSHREVAHAEEEGVEFLWLSAPAAFEPGGIVRARRMRLGIADASGRRAPEPDPAGDFTLQADLVIKALGFDAEDLPALFGAPELGVSRWGTVLVDGKTLMTSLDGVFAAGDIVRGASLVVWAIRDGRDVSAAMHAWLKAKAKAARGGGVRLAMILAVAVATATPVRAQVASAPTGVVAAARVDPVRLAAARPVIDRIWPLGTYARIMRATMDQVAQGAMAQMFDMKPEELAGTPGTKPGAAPASGQTLGQMAAKNDPYFQQRMQITMHVMGEEMGKLMTEVEPDVREALAHAYARRFTVAQLGELDRFFATPTGHDYAAESMTLMMSPDMITAMQGFLPRMMKAMPAMMARVAAATKDLPPPPAKKTP